MLMLEAHAIEKSLAGRRVLRGASLRVERGERLFVLGDNGSGKSTLLHVLSRVLDADAGSVTRNSELGFAPEKPDLPEHLRVDEWLDVVASLKRAPASPPFFSVDELLGKRQAALSLGQRQRVSLAAAWLGGPPLMILDEPTNGVDAKTRAEIAERLRNTTAIVATHDREFAAALATRVVSMAGGSVVAPV